MKSPAFSVVIPLYNKGGYIARTLESVLNQSCPDFEVVVVDDGSTDDGPEQVERLADPRLRLVRQENGGVSSARNRGIAEAVGEFIAFLDADDEWRPGKLEAHRQFFAAHPDCSWSVSGFTRRFRSREADASFGPTALLPDALAAIVQGLVVWTGAVVARRSCFRPDSLFPLGISRSEDREVWLKLACRYPELGYLGEPLAIYHVDTPGSLTSTASLEFDFSFFDLERRLAPVVAEIAQPRQRMFRDYLARFNRRACLSFTVASRNFLECAPEETLRRYLTRGQFFCLKGIAPWPAGLKRILARLMYAVGFF